MISPRATFHEKSQELNWVNGVGMLVCRILESTDQPRTEKFTLHHGGIFSETKKEKRNVHPFSNVTKEFRKSQEEIYNSFTQIQLSH